MSKYTKKDEPQSGPKIGIVVDAYSTGKYLPEAFAEHGFDLVHVQSNPVILPFDVASFQPENFCENIIFDQDFGTLVKQAGRFDPAFVVAGCESGVILADRLAKALNVPGNGTALSEARRNKAKMADAVRAAGLRAIRHRVCSSSTEAVDWFKKQRFTEAVIKPVDSAGTEDVYFTQDPTSVHEAMDQILGKVNGMGTLNTCALVQERITGEQFTINSVSIDGQHYLAELWSYYTVSIQGAGSLCSYETLLNARHQLYTQIETYVFNVLDALGIREGPAHIEIFVDQDGPVLIELGARMQGSMSRRARRKALGLDHVSLTALRYATPKDFTKYIAANTPYAPKHHAEIVSLLSDARAVVTGLSGLDQIRKLESFADAICMLEPGDALLPSQDLSSTAGIVYLVHRDPDLVEKDRKALQAMKILDIYDVLLGDEELNY